MKAKKIEYSIIPLSDLNPMAWNPRQISEQDRVALQKSIEHFGCVEPLVIRQEDMSIVGGHQRYNAACDLHLGEVPCVVVDISETEAKLLNIALNKIHGAWNVDKLSELIEELKIEDADIDLTGFDNITLTQAGVFGVPELDYEKEWGGMPSFDKGSGGAARTIIIHFATEEDVASFAELISQEIGDKTRFLWHPKRERREMTTEGFASES